MESEQTICANQQSLLDPPKRKRVRRDPFSEFEKNIVVLNSSDVSGDQEGSFLALNTMERAQLRRNKQRFKKVCFTQLMTEKEVQRKLEDPADGVTLLQKRRYKFASADGYGHLNYHGKECWNGSEIKSWLPGTSALYILLQGNNQNGKSKGKTEANTVSTSKAAARLCKDSSQEGSTPSSPESPSPTPTPSPSLSSSCSISYPSSSTSLSSMTLMVKAAKTAALIKREYSDMNESCEYGGASGQTSKETNSPQAVLSWSSSSSSSLPLHKSNLFSVGVSGTWFPPGPNPWAKPSTSCKCTPREPRTQNSTNVSSDAQTLKRSFQCPSGSEATTHTTVIKQEAQTPIVVMSSGSGELKLEASTSVQAQQNSYPSASSHGSACSTPGDYESKLNISTTNEIKDISPGKSVASTAQQPDNSSESLFEKYSDSETSDKGFLAIIKDNTASLLTSEESSVLRGSVQCRNELPARLVKAASTGRKQALPSGTRTVGETTSRAQTGNTAGNYFQEESEAKSGKFSQAQTQETVVADLTRQATLVFQQLFAQKLVASIGPLSNFLGGKSQEDKMVQCVSLDQGDAVAELRTSVDQSDIVEEIWPKEGPCTGGGAFVILLKQDLHVVSAGQPFIVRFRPGGITCAYLHHQHKDRLHGRSIPAAPCGISSVMVATEGGRVLGETTLTYRDHRSEVRLEINRLLDETFSWSREDPSGGRQDSLGSYEDITTRLASVVDAVESAARKGDKLYFRRMLANQRGRDSYKLCQNRGLDPENIAQENGHTDLATYLASSWPRISTEEDVQICEEEEAEPLHSGPQGVQSLTSEQVSDPLGILCEIASSRKPISQSADSDEGNDSVEQEICGVCDTETSLDADTDKPEDATSSHESADFTIHLLGTTPSSSTSSPDDLKGADYRRGAQWEENFGKKAMILPSDFATNPLTTMELAKLRKDRSEYGKVLFSKRMHENIVRETLRTVFSKLRDKRFSLAVMDHGRLSFHESECWNGRNIHKWCKNDKVLYIIPQKDFSVASETSEMRLLHDKTRLGDSNRPSTSSSSTEKNDSAVPHEDNAVTEDSHDEVQDTVMLADNITNKVQEYSC